MTRLDKQSQEELISISKKMFYGGFAFLPFLWLVNVVYLFPMTRRPSASRELKRYVFMSMGGCALWLVLSTTWYALFVHFRVSWGALADRITVVIPKGV